MEHSNRLTARPSTLSDAQFVGVRLRSEDQREIATASGSTDFPAILTRCMRKSKPCFTIYTPEKKPCAMFGTIPKVEFAQIWMVCTDDLLPYSRDFLRQSVAWWARFHQKYPVLWNIVDTRNTVHIRWLEWVGCKFGETLLVGVDQVPFIEFNHR